MLNRVGFFRMTNQLKNGMMTTYSVVRNELLEAVVSVSPEEFAQ